MSQKPKSSHSPAEDKGSKGHPLIAKLEQVVAESNLPDLDIRVARHHGQSTRFKFTLKLNTAEVVSPPGPAPSGDSPSGASSPAAEPNRAGAADDDGLGSQGAETNPGVSAALHRLAGLLNVLLTTCRVKFGEVLARIKNGVISELKFTQRFFPHEEWGDLFA